MLKIVPDPPPELQSLEDTLMHATDYALCAEAVAQQALQMEPRSPSGLLIAAAIHEIEALRKLLESALARVQMPVDSPMQR
ncbi:hypothetical protein [Pseudomonas cremoricolorata]|uniref:DUF3077 domain-containing protein n=1 Tax=Pseudomonas cremoricolorata TaxID=157783 RepID=A0A089WI14_9PSED|nr:hypothetical protein [Pseudomonas cremoricolorata]AIR88221.1 hypothetical protein LK03_02730 [Pseudomonas cremoricolorata]